MPVQVKDHFIDLERHRRQLEENVTKLQTALQHWRLCDAEYEELKEAVESKPDIISSEQLQQIRTGFKGEVVTDSEVDQLLDKPHKTVINLLDRRIDYVTKNIETLEKQLAAAEQKLATAMVVMDPDVRDEDGLPFTDIIEELDDDDNVVSSHLQRPGDMQPQMMEALAKAGIKDKDVLKGDENEIATVEGAEGDNMVQEDSKEGAVTTVQQSLEHEPTSTPFIQEQQTSKPEPQPPTRPQKPTAKRAVSFADDTKPGDDVTSKEDPISPISRNAQIMTELMEQARLQAIPSPNPVIPEDESPEDAELRREMLRYGMTDIAPIVAELAIDEEGDSEYEEAYSDFDDEDDDEDEYDEDGRYKYRVVDENIHARMQELQAKLGFKSTRELMEEETRMEIDDAEPDSNKLLDGGIGRITVKATETPKSALKTDNKIAEATPAKKGVKFASELDVSAPPTDEPTEPDPIFVDPMRTTIIERAPAAPAAPPAATTPKKVSRFKKAKTASTSIPEALPIRQPHTAPTRFLDADTDVRIAPAGPEGKTLADAVVERDLPDGVKEPDEFDAALLHQEAAVEYNRMRNRMIQKEGGFVKEREAAIEYPEDVDECGKRLSRFKAARLARQ